MIRQNLRHLIISPALSYISAADDLFALIGSSQQLEKIQKLYNELNEEPRGFWPFRSKPKSDEEFQKECRSYSGKLKRQLQTCKTNHKSFKDGCAGIFNLIHEKAEECSKLAGKACKNRTNAQASERIAVGGLLGLSATSIIGILVSIASSSLTFGINIGIMVGLGIVGGAIGTSVGISKSTKSLIGKCDKMKEKYEEIAVNYSQLLDSVLSIEDSLVDVERAVNRLEQLVNTLDGLERDKDEVMATYTSIVRYFKEECRCEQQKSTLASECKAKIQQLEAEIRST